MCGVRSAHCLSSCAPRQCSVSTHWKRDRVASTSGLELSVLTCCIYNKARATYIIWYSDIAFKLTATACLAVNDNHVTPSVAYGISSVLRKRKLIRREESWVCLVSLQNSPLIRLCKVWRCHSCRLHTTLLWSVGNYLPSYAKYNIRENCIFVETVRSRPRKCIPTQSYHHWRIYWKNVSICIPTTILIFMRNNLMFETDFCVFSKSIRPSTSWKPDCNTWLLIIKGANTA